jgi:hypothetical protein
MGDHQDHAGWDNSQNCAQTLRVVGKQNSHLSSLLPSDLSCLLLTKCSGELGAGEIDRACRSVIQGTGSLENEEGLGC